MTDPHVSSIDHVSLPMQDEAAMIAFYGALGFHVAGRHVEAVDTTAAGDAFTGALACALGEGRALTEALEFATAAAALSVTRMGAQSSLPDRAAVEALLQGRLP